MKDKFFHPFFFFFAVLFPLWLIGISISIITHNKFFLGFLGIIVFLIIFPILSGAILKLLPNRPNYSYLKYSVFFFFSYLLANPFVWIVFISVSIPDSNTSLMNRLVFLAVPIVYTLFATIIFAVFYFFFLRKNVSIVHTNNILVSSRYYKKYIFLVLISLIFFFFSNGIADRSQRYHESWWNIAEESSSYQDSTPYHNQEYNLSFRYPSFLQKTGELRDEKIIFQQGSSNENDFFTVSLYQGTFLEFTQKLEAEDQLENGISVSRVHNVTNEIQNDHEIIRGEHDSAIGIVYHFVFIPLSHNTALYLEYSELVSADTLHAVDVIVQTLEMQ
ncbi:MAG: hypothetical protein KBD15_02725 [Candidatus Magasanikbacteria bacterium]|nr:hypothetical protein [Candidatus Magasanikbacteria bacterium]